MIHLTDRKTSKPYPHVSVVYANNEEETAALLEDYIHQGYEYEITAVRDIKRLVIILDERYYYDQNRYLRSKHFKEGRPDVRNLFHQLNQAKEELSIIVREIHMYTKHYSRFYSLILSDKSCKLSDSPLKSPTIPYIIGILWGIFPA